MNWLKRFWINLIGADEGGKVSEGKGEAKTFAQEEVDRIVSERLNRERAKYSDYEDLRKFKEEHAKEQDKIKQEELVRQKKYEEAEGTYKKQLAERDALIAQKDQAIQERDIRGTLTNEIIKQNGFVEESLALLRGSAVLTKDGQVVIKVKDANGIEKEVSPEEGVKNFLGQRPHLVKVKTSGGSGTAPAGTGAGAGVDDLATLNTQLAAAMAKGDTKTVGELRKKILANPNIGNRRAL